MARTREKLDPQYIKRTEGRRKLGFHQLPLVRTYTVLSCEVPKFSNFESLGADLSTFEGERSNPQYTISFFLRVKRVSLIFEKGFTDIALQRSSIGVEGYEEYTLNQLVNPWRILLDRGLHRELHALLQALFTLCICTFWSLRRPRDLSLESCDDFLTMNLYNEWHVYFLHLHFHPHVGTP
jgi:hypothetical protein